MPRILAYTSPARGHLYPVTPILEELRSRRHEIVLRTLGSEVELMRSRGFVCEPLDPAVEVRHDDYLLEALSDEDVHVLATLPAQDARSLHVPANAHVENFVPHGPVLERAICAVTHGGMGATQKALARAVPVCAVPFGRDQLEVARRVEVSGAGTRLPARRLNPQRLRAKIRAAITCRSGAGRIASAFRTAGGPTAAADAIEKRLLTRMPRR